MKKVTKLGIICAFFYSQIAFSQEFKCFVELANDKSEIRLVKLPADKNAKEAEREILLHGVYASDGQRKINVLTVYECVPYAEKFTDAQAKQLEQKTPL